MSATGSISGHTKVTLPHEEAVKAPFPPGCKVLCFDENGFRVGIVRDVLVFISLHEEATYGTYYEVELKGANLQAGKTSVFTASDLRLTPDCPVQINPEYFGSVFQNDGSEGNIEGIVLGSFEIPTAYDQNLAQSGKYFYSVRVKVPGMDEAVEAHGVPPDHVTVLSSVSDNYDAASFANASIILGGGSYGDSEGDEIDHHNEKRSRSSQQKARRVSPEDMQTEEDFDRRSVRDGYYQEEFTEDSYYDGHSHEKSNGSGQKSIRNIISNTESHFYDDGSEIEFDKPVHTSSTKSIRKSRSPQKRRASNEHRKPTTSRSVSRTRTYVRSQTPVRKKASKIPYHDDNSLDRGYAEFKDKSGSHKQRRNSYGKMEKQRLSASPRETDDYSYASNHRQLVQYRGEEASENFSDGSGENMNANASNFTDEDYDSIIFQESVQEGYYDERRYSYGAQEQVPGPIQSPAVTPRERVQEVDGDFGQENLTPKSGTSSNSNSTPTINSQAENQQNPANVRAATPVRKKAFGKTWTPTNQMKVKAESTEQPKVGKLDGGVRSFTPLKTRSTTPLPSKNNVTVTPQPITTKPTKTPSEGCYLIFDEASGGRFIIQFSKAVVEEAIGFWAPGPGKILQEFKFKQNQGKIEMMKGIAGKDYKKKYFSGWCQFVKAAKNYNGYFIKYSEKGRIEVDIYVFLKDSCSIEKMEDGKLIDISEIAAVAVVGKGNNTFNGVKTGELGTFLNKGSSAGASLSL